MNFTTKALIGIGLIVVGTLAFFPALSLDSASLAQWLLIPATAAVTYGTYLVGTEGDGRPV